MSPWCFIRCLVLWLALAGAIAQGAQAAPSGAVAMVADLKGRAHTGPATAPKPLAILAELPAGAELVLEPGTDLSLVYLGSGHEFQITGSGRVTVGPNLPVFNGQGKLASRTSLLSSAGGKLDTGGGRMVQGAVVMRGAADRLRQIAPRQKALDFRPVFRWVRPENLSAVTFELRGGDGRTLVSTEVAGESYTLPGNLNLVHGTTYSWSIGPAGEVGATRLTADFVLAAPAEQEGLGQLKPDRNALFSDRVLYALLLEQAGFAGEAANHWKELSDQRPQDAVLRAKWAR